jgi:hypothetical protein
MPAVKTPFHDGVQVAERECSLPASRDDRPRRHVIGQQAPMRSRAYVGAQATLIVW